MLHSPPVTALYVALGALLLVLLTVRVVAVRRGRGIGLGDGGDKELLRRMRVHGNAIETLPIQLLLLAMLEWSGTSAPWLHALGAAVLISRCLHAWGMSGSSGLSFGRFWGTLLSLLLMIGMAVWLIFLSLS